MIIIKIGQEHFIWAEKSLYSMGESRGGGGGGGGGRGSGPPSPLINHKNIEFLCNADPDPFNNHKATRPAFNVWPSSARQRKAI